MVSAKKNDVDIYVYYEINKSGEEIDVRYIKENGKILCEYDIIRKLFHFYEEKDHELNKLLGTKLSVGNTLWAVGADKYVYNATISADLNGC